MDNDEYQRHLDRLVKEARELYGDIFNQIHYIELHDFKDVFLNHSQKQQLRLDILRILITTMEE